MRSFFKKLPVKILRLLGKLFMGDKIKMGKTVTKALFFISLLFCLALFIIMLILNISISKTYKVNKGEAFTLNSKIPITANLVKSDRVDTAINTAGEKYEVSLKIFGLIPFSTVNVEVVDKTYVSVLGQPFGMRAYTEGVLVIDTADIRTNKGRVNPAENAGIKIGDYILSVDNSIITCNEDLSYLVEKSKGSKMTFKIKRGDKTFTKTVNPALSSTEGEYRIGIWVRDSSAGIGTLTFYSPASGIVCGLGHGLNDSDTGKLLSVETGQMVSAEIVSVKKGKSGTPGELGGRFTNETIADITLNAKNGVYGTAAYDIPSVNLTQVAMNQEIVDGPAQILCTLQDDVPKLYSCTVKRHSESVFGGIQNLSVKITDSELLENTGGIVQGMSGSPVLQNGKLIGAITHVLVDDPTTGYAVFAESMLDTALEINNAKLKAAG